MTRAGCLVAVLLATGCERRAPPPPARTPAPSSSAATSVAPSASAAVADAGAPPSTPTSFGPWVRCYAGFRPETLPVRDVQRLAMLCGPSLGMRPAWPIAEGDVAEGAPPREHALELGRGECTRIFAVSADGVPDLDLELVGPTGAVVVEDAIDDRWPVVPSDRAWCVSDGGAYRVRLRARKGKGAYAVQAWVLP